MIIFGGDLENRLVIDVDFVSRKQLSSPTGFQNLIDPNPILRKKGLDLSATLNDVGKLQKLPKCDKFTVDPDYLHSVQPGGGVLEATFPQLILYNNITFFSIIFDDSLKFSSPLTRQKSVLQKNFSSFMTLPKEGPIKVYIARHQV
jgi:hypothetical protein